MEIVRLENGNVELRNGGVMVWSIPQLPTEIKPIDNEDRDHVKLFQSDGRVEYLNIDEITETQVLPNAAVPFSGDVFDLADLMSSDFFYNSSTGSGGTVPSFGEVIVNKTYKVLNILTDTVIETVDLDDGFTYSFEVVGLSQRGTGRTGSFVKVVRFFGRVSGVSTAGAEQIVFNSAAYSVRPELNLVGNSVEVVLNTAGAIPINWNAELKVTKIQNT